MGKDSSSFDEVTRSRTIVGVRTTNSNLAVCREPIARCLVRAAQSQKGRSIWSRRTLLLRVVKNGRTQSEHMSSGLPPRADIVRCGPHVANVATTGLMRRSKLVAGKPLKCELPFARPRQYDFELGEKPWLRLDLMLPACCFTMMSWLIDRPCPVPSPEGFVVKKGLNIFFLTSSGMSSRYHEYEFQPCLRGSSS
jgi:hypothetical protein